MPSTRLPAIACIARRNHTKLLRVSLMNGLAASLTGRLSKLFIVCRRKIGKNCDSALYSASGAHRTGRRSASALNRNSTRRRVNRFLDQFEFIETAERRTRGDYASTIRRVAKQLRLSGIHRALPRPAVLLAGT